MILFVFGRFFERRTPRRQRDALPLEPLIDVILFWTLLSLGGLMASIAGSALFIEDGFSAMEITMLAVASIVCLAGAFRFWRKLIHSH